MSLYCDGTFDPGTVIVVFKRDTGEDQAKGLVTSLNLEAGVWMNILKMLVVYVPTGSEQEWVKQFRANPIVLTATLNRIVKSRRRD